MPMNTLARARHLNSSASTPIRKVITPSRITIALCTLVMSLSNIIGLPRRWTMDYAWRSLLKMSNRAGFSVAQNSSAPASAFSTTAASGCLANCCRRSKRRQAKGASASLLELDADPLRKVLVLDRLVALAGVCFERRTVEDGGPAAAIAEDAALLQLLGE